jgi:hypothetical protein
MSKAIKSVGGAVKKVASNPLGGAAIGGAVMGPVGSVLGASGFFSGQKAPSVDLQSGRPQRPGFQTLLGVDEATGKYNRLSLPQELQAPDVVGAAGINQLKDIALSEGLSKQGQAQTDWAQLQEAENIGQIGKQANAQLAEAQGNIARTGGLRSGVGALLQAQGMRDQMMQKQQTRRGGIGDRLNIQMQDAQNKQNLLQSLVGQDLQSRQYNVGNVLGEKRAKDASDLAAYNADMSAWAAGKQGEAIRKSAPKGGLLGFLGI